MPIIIDNFHVNVATPIDNRFVVGSSSFYSTKEDITYKYLGLRIWDLNDNIPYYWAGTVSGWLSENSVGVLADTNSLLAGEPDYIAKFISGSTVIGKSLIYENQANKQLGIGLTGSNISANYSSTSVLYGLHVAGNIKSNNYFIGKGRYITDINATNINNGLLTVNRIAHFNITSLAPNIEYVLFNEGITNSVRWRAASGLSVLNSTNTTNVNISEENSSSSSHYITFVQATTGNLPIKVSSSKLQFNPGTGQLFLNDGNPSTPVYSFLNSTATGMYYDGYNIGFTKQGNNFVSIVDHGIAVKSPNWPQISFINTTTNSNKLLWVSGDSLFYRVDAGNATTDKRIWHQDNLYTLKHSGDLLPEINRSINSISYDAGGTIVKGVYTYNVKSTQITNIAGNTTTSQNTFFSVLSFGRGDDGSVQLASNWFGGNATPVGNVVADREILIRSLRDSGPDTWSPWVKIWNSGNSGYVPFGAIMMWSGTIAQIPTGWRLCDGNNNTTVSILAGSVPGQSGMTTITIPDLRERFVVGAGGDNNGVITYIYDRTGTTYGDFTFMYYGSPVIDYTQKVQTGGVSDNYNEYYPNDPTRVATTGQVTGAYFMYNTGGNYFYYIDYNGKIQKGNVIDSGTQYSTTTTTINNTIATPTSWTGDKYFGRVEAYSQAYGFYHVYTKKFETDGTTPQVTSTKSGYWYWIFDKRTQNYVLVRGTFNGDASIGTTAGANAVTNTTTPIIYKTGMGVGFSYTPFQKYTNAGAPVTDANTGQPIINNAKRIQMQGVIWPSGSYNVGDKGGLNDVQLTSATTPQHTHIADRWTGGWASGGSGPLGQGTGYRNNTQQTSPAGGDQTHENRPPFYALAFIIYTGI